jgi:hypothetical protein
MKRRQSRETFSYRVQFRVPGGMWVWATDRGTGTMNPDGAKVFPSKEAAEDAARRIQGPHSSLQAKVVPMPIKPGPARDPRKTARRTSPVRTHGRSWRDPSATRAADRPWRVRDRLTRHCYYFESRPEALAFVDNVSTSEITGEPLARWRDRLIVERNRRKSRSDSA